MKTTEDLTSVFNLLGQDIHTNVHSKRVTHLYDGTTTVSARGYQSEGTEHLCRGIDHSTQWPDNAFGYTLRYEVLDALKSMSKQV